MQAESPSCVTSREHTRVSEATVDILALKKKYFPDTWAPNTKTTGFFLSKLPLLIKALRG